MIASDFELEFEGHLLFETFVIPIMNDATATPNHQPNYGVFTHI